MNYVPRNVVEMVAVGLLPYPIQNIEEFKSGLINSSYKITTKDAAHPNYLLQKINHNVFKDVESLQYNIKMVTDHIRQKLHIKGIPDIDRHVLTPISIGKGENSKLYYWDSNGDYWRLFLFIEDSHSYEKMENPQMAEVAGRAFGQFHKHLKDFPAKRLCEVIPNFHNTPVRVENLRRRVAINPADRLKYVNKEVDFLLNRSHDFLMIAELGEKGSIPTRVVHQDTKFNNILFDKNGEVLCIVDLDTVMPGYICYDVGDAIRSGANTGKEDDKDVNNIQLDMDVFKGFLKGFLDKTRMFLKSAEIDTLAYGAKLLTYEQAVRFLDDFLDGDKYYKVEYPEHNLVRARAQIKLLQSIESHFKEMNDFVKNCGLIRF